MAGLRHRALRTSYDATQSTSYFVTSWSKHKRRRRTSSLYLHSPEQMNAWYAATGTPPADDRFDTSKITTPLDKQLYAARRRPGAGLLQDFFPPQIDLNGNAPAQQLVLGGQGDAAAAAQIRERAAAQWRARSRTS